MFLEVDIHINLLCPRHSITGGEPMTNPQKHSEYSGISKWNRIFTLSKIQEINMGQVHYTVFPTLHE